MNASIAAPMPRRLGVRLGSGDLLALAFFATIIVLSRAVWLGDPVADFDEQLYSFIGWRMTHGELPFINWWDRKPFGLFAIFAAAHGLLGPEPLAYQIIAALFAFAGAVLVYALARQMVCRASAAISGAIYLMLMAAYGSYSGQSEVFFAPLMLGMVWLLRDPAHPAAVRRACWAMLLGGLALQVKYTVLPQCLFLGGFALWSQWRRGLSTMGLGKLGLARLAALFAVLGLLPTILIGLFYAAIGQLDAYVFANFLSFFDRIAAPQGRWITSHLLGTAPLAILVLGGIYGAFRIRAPANWPLFWLFTGWAAASLATVLLPGTVYLYYYAAMVPAASLVALPLIDRGGPLRLAPGLILLAACAFILDVPSRYAKSQEERGAAEQLAAAIKPHVGSEHDCLWIFDGPVALYRMTGSCVATRFVYPDHLNNALETDALGVDQAGEVARILGTMPGTIVTADKPVTAQNDAATALVKEELNRSYYPIITVPMHHRKLTAWVRREK